MIGEFENLPFDDAADAIQVCAPLAFKLGGIFRLLAQKKKSPTQASTASPASGSVSRQFWRSSFNACLCSSRSPSVSPSASALPSSAFRDIQRIITLTGNVKSRGGGAVSKGGAGRDSGEKG